MFRQARIKLTLWYITILMVVSMLFSVTIYRMLTLEVARFAEMQRNRIERRIQNENFFPTTDPLIHPPSELPLIDPDLVNEVNARIMIILFGINGIILVVAGGLSYFLAGKTLSPIQKMHDEQNRFIADASHELRTPLTAIKTSFEVLLRNKHVTVDEAKSVIGDSMTDVDSLQKLTDSLLQLASAPEVSNTHHEALSLNEIISTSIRRITPLAQKNKIRVTSVSTPCEVYGDRHSLTELFSIIYDNAVKYGKAGTAVVTDISSRAHRVTVKITDHGIGIDEKNLSHIFDRFYRADEARTRNGHDGYGLGLAIAKKIVEQHKGLITVKSAKDKGTSVIVELPTASVIG